MARIATITDKPPSYWQSGWSGRVVDGWRTRRDQAGGGVVLMNSIHQLDALRYVTGLAIVGVWAKTATLSADAEVEVEDAASAAMSLSNGGLASLAVNANSPGAGHEERIEIDGACGRIDLPDPSSGAPVRLFLRRPWQDHPAGEWIDIPTAHRDSHVEMVRAFGEAVRTGTAPPAAADAAAAALATVLAVYECPHRPGRDTPHLARCIRGRWEARLYRRRILRWRSCFPSFSKVDGNRV